MRTLTAGLPHMAGPYEVRWGQLSAGVVISTIPVANVLTFVQKHLIRGLTAGTMKG
jgi:multiple sugar transport system permease protein